MTPDERRQQRMIAEYMRNVGREPRTLYPDDPDWNYTGRPEEREALAQRIDRLEDIRILRGQEQFDFGDAA